MCSVAATVHQPSECAACSSLITYGKTHTKRDFPGQGALLPLGGCRDPEVGRPIPPSGPQTTAAVLHFIKIVFLAKAKEVISTQDTALSVLGVGMRMDPKSRLKTWFS